MAFHARPCVCSACVLAMATTRVNLIGKEDRPFERLHPAERSAGHGREPFDPQLMQERTFGAHHVGDGDHRKVRSVWPARARIQGRGPGRPAAATEQVGRDDEVAIGVERLAWADHPVPPSQPFAPRSVTLFGGEPVARALGGRCLRETGRVRIAAERVADEDDVVARGRQRAVGLVRDSDRDESPFRNRAAPASASRGTASRQSRRSRPRASGLTSPSRDHSASCRAGRAPLYDPDLSRVARRQA